jgi:hypothetical protein
MPAISGPPIMPSIRTIDEMPVIVPKAALPK